jgi:putative nucleotidyltransferase with HDIG domain
MADKPTEKAVAHQTELVIGELESLSTLPSVAAQFFPKFLQPQFSPSDLADIIESDAALTAKILSIIHQQRANTADEEISIREALGKLQPYLIRDAILSVEVFGAFDADHSPDNYRALPRKQLALHNLAVACCAKEIAEIISPKVDAQMAYYAGLLHDIGKIALDQKMPKSFTQVISEAKSQHASACTIEQKQLGLDHTILGKRLAQKWNLPSAIVFAIWLHHSDTDLISQDMPEAKIAHVVQLADLIARQCSIGQSGSYDIPVLPPAIVKSLGINPEQLQQIRHNLTEQVAQKSKVLGIDSPSITASFGEAIHTTVSQLAQNNTKLSLENRQLQTISSYFDFATEFLLSTNSSASPIEVAKNFAARWQKFYQTGTVCLYLKPPTGSEIIEAVVVENPSRIKAVVLNPPADLPSIPQPLTNNFAILSAEECNGGIDWLLEQLDIDFDLNQMKIIPLLSNGKTIGAIIFEFRYPSETDHLQERFKASSSVAGTILEMAFASQKQQQFAEQFVRSLGKTKSKQDYPFVEDPLSALAEMAGGAAHELNNPLSVISGRAQLLAQAENDPEKARILSQIQENASEISQIIEDLMAFAQPPQPKFGKTEVKQMLDEASQLAAQRQHLEELDVQIEADAAAKNIFVDSGQVVSAIANVFSNALESYTAGTGPIKVAAAMDESGDFLKLQITDFGCGMDQQTLQKATQPFFSAKPAGRKRGMGLAHAKRLVQLNRGSLDIASQAGSGTTVTILLPRKQ